MDSGVIVFNDFFDGSKGVIDCGRPTHMISVGISDAQPPEKQAQVATISIIFHRLQPMTNVYTATIIMMGSSLRGLITDPPDLSRSGQIQSDPVGSGQIFFGPQMAVIGPNFLTKFQPDLVFLLGSAQI